jgi:uncharacterized protein YjbI with pentapeptide repeats
MKNFYTGGFLAFYFVLFSSAALAKASYNPSQLEQFLQTNACPACDLSSALIYGNHSQANLDKVNLSDAGASNMHLSEAKLTNANLTRTDFGNTNLSGADFTGSALQGARFDGANLYMAKITPQQLTEASSVCGAIMPDGSEGKCAKR